jgi:hypothetical protein
MTDPVGSLDAVLCPHPPLLARALGGQQDPVVELREACGRAVSQLVDARPELIVVVGPARESGPRDGLTFDVRRFGTTQPRPATADSLPLSLGIGRTLLDDCGWAGPTTLVGVGWDAPDEELVEVAERVAGASGATGVLMLGDGSACRSEKAPGYLDPRAFGYDDVVAAALGDGDAATLRDLDGALGRELMVGGRSVFRLLGRIAGERPVTATLDYRDDPFGISYFVARWSIS